MKNTTLAGSFLAILFIFLLQTTSWAQQPAKRPLQAKGEVIEKKRKVGDFSGVDVKGNFTVILTFGKRTEMRIEAPENMHNNIVSGIQEGMLVVYAYREFVSPEPVKIFVTLERLDNIRANSSAWVICDESLNPRNTQANQLMILSRGAAKVEATLDSLAVKVSAFEAGTVTLKGNTPRMTAEVEGGSTLAASSLTASYVHLRAKTGSSANIVAEEELEVTVSDGATVYYKGRPRLSQDVKSGGKLRRL